MLQRFFDKKSTKTESKILAISYHSGEESNILSIELLDQKLIESIQRQLSGYKRIEIPRKIATEQLYDLLPAEVDYQKQFSRYFYTVSCEQKDQLTKIKITGSTTALQSAIEALINGSFCTPDAFKECPKNLCDYAQSVQTGEIENQVKWF